jgi:TadE-like protein
MMAFMKRLSRAFRREEGTSTVEFVLCVPVLMTTFMMSLESGMFMIKSVMLDRAVDLTVRELRTGDIADPSSTTLKAMICENAVILSGCYDSIMLELAPINETTWSMPTTEVTCINRDEAVQPVLTMDTGGGSEIMLVRVCVLVDALFPTTGLGEKLVRGSSGEIGLVAVSAFVNEPS